MNAEANAKAIVAAREKVTQIGAEIERIESGIVPVPKDEAMAGIVAFVDELAGDCIPRVSNAAVNASRGDSMAHNFWNFETPKPVVGLLAWLDRDAMIAKMQAAVELLYQSIDESLPTSDRPKRIAKLRSEYAAAERVEYELVEKAIAAGLNFKHRPDMNPSLLLGLQEVSP